MQLTRAPAAASAAHTHRRHGTAPPFAAPHASRRASNSGKLVVRYRDATQASEVDIDAPSWRRCVCAATAAAPAARVRMRIAARAHPRPAHAHAHAHPPCSTRRHFMESDDPKDESSGMTGLIQQAKATMRDSPVKLADLALPALGALGSVALSNEHDWPGVDCALRVCVCFLGGEGGEGGHMRTFFCVWGGGPSPGRVVFFKTLASCHPGVRVLLDTAALCSPPHLRDACSRGRGYRCWRGGAPAAAGHPGAAGELERGQCVGATLAVARTFTAVTRDGGAPTRCARCLLPRACASQVPFTLRRHTILLPVFAELLLGQFSFAQVRAWRAVVAVCCVCVPLAMAMNAHVHVVFKHATLAWHRCVAAARTTTSNTHPFWARTPSLHPHAPQHGFHRCFSSPSIAARRSPLTTPTPSWFKRWQTES
jgi:hypothetical protein